MNVKRLFVVIIIILTTVFIYGKATYKGAVTLASKNNNQDTHVRVISIHNTDLDSDGNIEQITYYYKPTDTNVSTFISIDTNSDGASKILYDQPVEENIYPSVARITTYVPNNSGEIVGFVALPKGFIGIVVKTSVQGSGGFTGYKVIGKQNNDYKVIYEQSGLKNGKVSIAGGGNYIQEEYDYPLASDSSCCSTNIKYKLIKFVDNKPVVISEVQEKNYWLKFQDAISKTY